MTSKHENMNLVLEAVFGFKEAGLKVDVTMWVPRFTQSVLVMTHKMGLWILMQ